MASDVKKVRQAGSYELASINLLFLLIKWKRALVWTRQLEVENGVVQSLMFSINGSELWRILMVKTSRGRKWCCAIINVSDKRKQALEDPNDQDIQRLKMVFCNY